MQDDTSKSFESLSLDDSSSLPTLPPLPEDTDDSDDSASDTSGSEFEDDKPGPPPTAAQIANFEAYLEIKHPLLERLVTPHAFAKIKREALLIPLEGYDWIAPVREGLFSSELKDTFPELLQSLREGGAAETCLLSLKEIVAFAESSCGIGEALIVRKSARQLMEEWDIVPPRLDLTVMTGAVEPPVPFKEFLKMADADEAQPKLYHGTTVDASAQIMLQGFSFRPNAGEGDLGGLPIVYFSNKAHFAAAWAILKTHPLTWEKQTHQIQNLPIAILSVERPAPDDTLSYSLPETEATYNWMMGNQALVKNPEMDKNSGHPLRFRVPLENGKLISEYAWIEGPFPKKNILAWENNLIANVTGLGGIARKEASSLRQWGFTEIGLHPIPQSKVWSQ